MNVTLKPEQAEFIQQKLNSGKYSNVDEVIVEAFRLLISFELAPIFSDSHPKIRAIAFDDCNSE